MRWSSLLYFAGALCVGITVGEYTALQPGMVVAGLVLSAVFFQVRRTKIICVILLTFLFGMSRIGSMMPAAEQGSTFWQGKHWTGTIMQRPAVSYGQTKLMVTALRGRQSWPGKMELTVEAATGEWAVGQMIRWQCSPEPWPPEEYIKQREKNVRATCSPEKIAAAQELQLPWRAYLAKFQDRLRGGIEQQLRTTQASLMVGILFGAQSDMPRELREQFQKTGTTHMVALSGFNVTIIITLMMNWARQLVGRKIAVGPSLGLVILFVTMTGASASVVRAAVMAVVVQLGMMAGRPIAPWRLLLYALILMIIQNPLVLRHDLGFQLSFLATAGLVLGSDTVKKHIGWVTEKFSMRENLSATLAAMAFTEPLLLGVFGRLSIIAPLTNTLVLPLIPLAMAIGAVLSIVAWVLPGLSGLVAQPLDALLRMILSIIDFCATISWSSVSLSGPTLAAIAGIFMYVSIIILTHAKKSSPV